MRQDQQKFICKHTVFYKRYKIKITHDGVLGNHGNTVKFPDPDNCLVNWLFSRAPLKLQYFLKTI